MTPSRPYLIRALYEWIVDNSYTPYMLVEITSDSIQVPRAFVENDHIILNISPEATHSLVLGNEAVTFNARFSGDAMDVNVPVLSVIAVYARENGQGMDFRKNDDTPPEPPTTGAPSKKTAAPSETKRPNLTIVK